MGKFILLLTSTFVVSVSCLGQNLKADSLKIEKSLLSAIGNIRVLDSLETALLRTTTENYTLKDTYLYNLSKARFLSGQLDLAFTTASKGIIKSKSEYQPYRSAKFYNLQASVYAYKKNYTKAIATFKKSLSILEDAKDTYTAAQVENNIANIFFGLSDFASAYQHSKRAYTELSKIKDTVHLPGVAGIFAISALKLKNLKEGKKLANESLRLSKKYNNPIGLIVSNHSLGEAYTEEGLFTEAISAFNASLEYSEMYRQAHFIMLNKVGLQHAYLLTKEFEKSISYGEEALQETRELKNENTLYAIHKNLGYALKGIGRNDEGFEQLSLAHNLYISSSGTENQKAINDILIKYDTEKKEKALVKSRLKNLKNENLLYKRNQWITGLSAILVFLLFSYFFYNRIQKQKLNELKKEQEFKRLKAAISAEEKERERISNELHDGMASSITGLKIKLEDLSNLDENEQLKPLVVQMQKLHDETRRMSHNLMPLGLNKENWSERLAEYCRENSSPSFQIHFSNNLKGNIPLDTSVSILLYRSIQELVHNAQKHAQTDTCTVQISQLNNKLIVSVEDEGIGMNLDRSKGQGIESMRKRLLEIGASLEIETQEERGTLISISIIPST